MKSFLYYLYYLKFYHKGKPYWKIGITSRSLKERYPSLDIHYAMVWPVSNLRTALKKEKDVLNKFKGLTYSGLEPILADGGDSEIFIKDVLNMDDRITKEKIV